MATSTFGKAFENMFRHWPSATDRDAVVTQLDRTAGTDTQHVQVGPGVLDASVTATADTFLLSVASNLPRRTLTATGATVLTIEYPILFPQSADGTQGWKLTGGTIYSTIATAALTSNALALSEVTYAAPPTGASKAITVTMPTAAGDYATAWTVDTPTIIDGDSKFLSLVQTVTAQNTGVFRLYGARLNFTQA